MGDLRSKWRGESGSLGFFGVFLNFTLTRVLYVSSGVVGAVDETEAAAATWLAADLKLIEAFLESAPTALLLLACNAFGLAGFNAYLEGSETAVTAANVSYIMSILSFGCTPQPFRIHTYTHWARRSAALVLPSH